jgi:chromosome segregation ATPase
MLWVIADARADDMAGLRQELDALKSKIEQIDADINATEQGSAEIKDATDAYAAKVKTNVSTGEVLKQRAQQLAATKAHLDNEHAAAQQTCHKTTATTNEYEAALAECEKAGKAYQQDADAYRVEQQHFANDYATYNTATAELKTQYENIEQKRQQVLSRQASLHDTRQETLSRFNEIRDHLMALQASGK